MFSIHVLNITTLIIIELFQIMYLHFYINIFMYKKNMLAALVVG